MVDFHSLMKYGIIFWGNSLDAQRILILQKRITQNIAKEQYLAHFKQIFQELSVFTMTSLLMR